MKKNQKFFFFAIIAMVAFSSACNREEKRLTWSHQDSLNVKTAIKRTVDNIMSAQRKADSLTKEIDSDIFRAEVLVKAFGRPHHQSKSVNGISVDWGQVNEILQNRNQPEEYRVECDRDCLSDHEWPITDTTVEHTGIPQEATTLVSRKSFSFHNIVTDPYDSIKFDRVYAGVLMRSNHLFKNGEDYTHLSGRVAFSLSVHPYELKWMDFEGAFSLDVNDAKKKDVTLQIQYNLHPTKWITVSAGYIPQIPTMSRPDFVSEKGQNELHSEALLPGTTPGVSIKIHPWNKDALASGESCSIQTGIFLDGWDHYSAQIGVDAPFEENFKMQYAFWVSKLGGPAVMRGMGMSLKYDLKYMSMLYTFSSGGINQYGTREPFNGGGFVKVPLFWTSVRSLKNAELVCDAVYNSNTYHWTHFEFGVGWKFSTGFVGGALRATYDPYNNTFNTGVLIHTR